MFYCVDKTTGKRTSLKTLDRDEAQQIIEARNQSERQPAPFANGIRYQFIWLNDPGQSS